MTRGTFILVAAIALGGPSHATGQLHLGLGAASIHRASSTGGIAIAGWGRALGSDGVVRVGGVAGLGTADDAFLMMQAGIEIQPVPDGRLMPFFGARVGSLWEPEFSGTVGSVIGGAALRFSEGRAFRVEGGWSRHGGESGPHYLVVALEIGSR